MVALPLVVSGNPDDLDRMALVKLIESAQQASCQDVSFDYEGKYIVPGEIERTSQRLGPDGVKLVYTGTFRRRADSATLIDLYCDDKRTNRPRHEQVAIFHGMTEVSSIRADEKKAAISISRQQPMYFAGPGNFRAIWLADWVRQLAESPYLYDFLGMKTLDGVGCLVVRFRLVLDETLPREKQISHTFWIDMNRGGHVVRHEQRTGDDLVILTTVVLKAFNPSPGLDAWLPISGRLESRLALRNGQPKYLDVPVYYETYFLLPLTLRFNQGLKDSAFSVKAKPGDVVSDELRKAKYEFGQYMVRPRVKTKLPTDAEVQANLERMLKDSKVMANELKASSPLRDGPGWMARWPWAVALLAAGGIGFVVYRRRGG